VTRLGEFSPIAQLFSLGSFFKKRLKQPKLFWLLFVHSKKIHFYFEENGLCFTLGDFFKNSSGHPELKSLFDRDKNRLGNILGDFFKKNFALVTLLSCSLMLDSLKSVFIIPKYRPSIADCNKLAT
jgi:hypothetical protein